jgi:hypothetical protein
MSPPATFKAQSSRPMFRGIHYDLTRGNMDSLDSLRRLARLVAGAGLNELVLYMEDRWKYLRHPQLSHPRAYKLEDLERLAQYAKTEGVDLVPSLTTMGHSRHILEKPRYRHLAFPNSAEFNVLNPAVYELLDDLFREVLPYFSSPYVFINGDEMNLSQLSDKALVVARERGLGALHGEAMGRIARMVLEYGRRPIMWHDMLFHHPEGLDHIPEGTIIACWSDDYQPAYPAAPFLCSLGFDTITVPALLPGRQVNADYSRGIPGIERQIKEAVLMPRFSHWQETARNGQCLGSMTVLGGQTGWRDSSLGVYATGQWMRHPQLSRDRVLRSFARDFFGMNHPGLGRAWVEASLESERAVRWKAALAESRRPAEKQILENHLKKIRKRLKQSVATLLRGKATRNFSAHHCLKERARAMLVLKRLKPTPLPAPKLLAPSLIDARDQHCHLVERRTRYGHRLVVLTNGQIAVAILPEFGAAMIEWVVLDDQPWSVIHSNYAEWASERRHIPGDPALGSPWSAHMLGGWRETVFFNARLSPSSLWGRRFTLQVRKCTDNRVTVECIGQNEVAEIRRKVTLVRGRRTITIETEAINRMGACYLALQPGALFGFPGVTEASLRLSEISGKRRTSRFLLEHDGTRRFEPKGNIVRVESPFTGHYLQLFFHRPEVAQFLTEDTRCGFTLDPLGAIRPCREGQSVRLNLEYEIGQ